MGQLHAHQQFKYRLGATFLHHYTFNHMKIFSKNGRNTKKKVSTEANTLNKANTEIKKSSIPYPSKTLCK